jgi:glycosyltransferase involved in cell wall biosynthesis
MHIFSKLLGRFHSRRRKPRILLLVDYRNWAFDNSARSIASLLEGKFQFEIRYVNDDPKPKLARSRYDLVHVFFWGETYHTRFRFPPSRVIKEISSHRFEDDDRFGPCTPAEMADRFLGDAETFCATSQRLHRMFSPICNRCYWTPNGIEADLFYRVKERSGEIVFGWAGNAKDPVKGLEDILLPACGKDVKLEMAPGDVNRAEMNEFYNHLDVFLVGSRHEGEPLTLLEAMAAGCFPVCSDVGIAREVIEDGINGLIVSSRTPEGFRTAIEWCRDHVELVRSAGKENAERIVEVRSWEKAIPYFENLYSETLEYANSAQR